MVSQITHIWNVLSVNNGEYINAVCDRNQAENISRVLYPNDNVSSILKCLVLCEVHFLYVTVTCFLSRFRAAMLYKNLKSFQWKECDIYFAIKNQRWYVWYHYKILFIPMNNIPIEILINVYIHYMYKQYHNISPS